MIIEFGTALYNQQQTPYLQGLSGVTSTSFVPGVTTIANSSIVVPLSLDISKGRIPLSMAIPETTL